MPGGSTLTWWTLLCGLGVLNAVGWLASAWWLRRQNLSLSPEFRAMQRWQLLLSAVYVLGCGYRSMLPVFDVPRQVMVDSWASSVLIGRSVATLAELCFAAQWALLLRGLAQAGGQLGVAAVARSIVPLIVLAELCSWTAVLTTANLGHVIEEALWGLGALLLCLAVVRLAAQASTTQARALLSALAVAAALYAAYMFAVDVPMYWQRWLSDEAAGRGYLSLAEGLEDAARRWVVTHRWEDWREEVIWMTAYFSLAVWLSIALAHARVPLRRAVPQRR